MRLAGLEPADNWVRKLQAKVLSDQIKALSNNIRYGVVANMMPSHYLER